MIHQPAPGWEWVSSQLQGDKQFKFEEWNLISTTLRNCSWNMKTQNSYNMQGDRAFICSSFSPLVCKDAIVWFMNPNQCKSGVSLQEPAFSAQICGTLLAAEYCHSPLPFLHKVEGMIKKCRKQVWQLWDLTLPTLGESPGIISIYTQMDSYLHLTVVYPQHSPGNRGLSNPASFSWVHQLRVVSQ